MNEERLNNVITEAKQRRAANYDKLRRRVEMGYVNGKVLSNGGIMLSSPKGIQNWYTTRQLIEKVVKIFDRNEALIGRRVCHINGKWQLQIRGKHLRRLLKAKPEWKQVGRQIVEVKDGTR
jgi:hypothetical protein